MPTPFMCHWCDKPTLEKSGICIKCEQAYEEGNKEIAATVRELEIRIGWYENALKEIIKCCDLRDNYGMIEDLAKTALDGEPTTADKYNKDFIEYRDTGDEHDFNKNKQSITQKRRNKK
tara:strand:- start:21932 stop:22288 length:357 start_codon:yes stop_codon:yes gene_type:complete